MKILVITESGSLYDLAAGFAKVGCNVAFAEHGSDKVEIDQYEVVHVSNWRMHSKDADVLITDSAMVYYKYIEGGGGAPVLFYSNVEFGGAARLVPPSALAFLGSLLLGAPVVQEPKRFNWRFWRR